MIVGVRQQARRAGIGGDPDILEDVGAEQEADVVGERVERLPGLDQPGSDGERGEARARD